MDKEIEDLNLTDLISVEILQKIQDSFSDMTGMAALTTDMNGKPVTKGSNFTDYCFKYTRQSELGKTRCEQCDRMGAVQAMETGRPTCYECHSGLTDFAAPIVVGGKQIGCFIGGQVLPKEPDPVKIQEVAKQLGIDFPEYWEAIRKVAILPMEKIEKATNFLYTTASVLSDMAYSSFKSIEASREIERAAKMKSDFLANMSHEIRTPMNAVIGMAEMALREQLPPAAKDYIIQIKSSGSSLLNIINDILDFSKIDSGKMEIHEEEYEPLSLFNDVANIVMIRLKDKNVELILDINPNFPARILGDNLRVRQVLINLANNAVKFTNRGRVRITVDFDKTSEDSILMKVAVQDTGIGIRAQDLNRLFHSFQQVDSKRNRNVEGTGLGLAISQKLLQLMKGEIHVESEYNKGSTFSFEVPQKVIDWTPAISVKESKGVIAMGFIENRFLAKQFHRVAHKLGVYSIAITAPNKLDTILKYHQKNIEGKRIYFFFENESYNEEIQKIVETYPDINFMLIANFFDSVEPKQANVRVTKKPLSSISIAMALNDEEMHLNSDGEAFTIDFTAPEAEIMIVDDNAINLTVAEGLMEPMNMKITTATSGQECLDKLNKRHYDIIFMDHMMPDMDGVETTRIIRRMHPECDDTVIIALTANAMDGTKEMFLSEGMNDFVAKPIEMRILATKIKQWLPEEKIVKSKQVSKVEKHEEQESIRNIGDLNVSYAVQLVGSEKLYWSILKEYYKNIEAKASSISQAKHLKDWKTYTIEVHALKSASKQIGAMVLSEMAAELEKAGNALDETYIRENTQEALEKYISYIDVLKPFFTEEKKEEGSKKDMDTQEVQTQLQILNEALADLDMDTMEEAVKIISEYKLPQTQEDYLQQIIAAIDSFDTDACDTILQAWGEELLRG